MRVSHVYSSQAITGNKHMKNALKVEHCDCYHRNY